MQISICKGESGQIKNTEYQLVFGQPRMQMTESRKRCEIGRQRTQTLTNTVRILGYSGEGIF